MPGTTTAGTDARFANLLEPIRDLAQNWSIDIASELEEYLGELLACCGIRRGHDGAIQA